MARILYVHSRRNTFTRIDREALAERHEVIDYLQPGFRPRPLELWRGVRSCDLVFGWFASWHTALALRFARALRKPSVLIFGGFDTANMPEIGYGSQRGGVRRRMVRTTAGLATRLITNSNNSLAEIEQNVSIDPARVRVVYHGIPDRFPDAAERPERDRMALTVGAVYSVNLARKGHGPFMAAARTVPDVDFVLAGEWWDETGERLAAEAPANARVTGRLSDEDLDALELRAADAANVLQGHGGGASTVQVVSEDGVIEVASPSPVVEQAGERGQRFSGASTASRPAAPARAEPARSAQPKRGEAPLAGRSAAADAGVEAKEVAWLFDAAAALGVDAESYERYATKRWGQGWKKAAGGRKRALEDLTPFQDDGAGFVEKVKGELEVWA